MDRNVTGRLILRVRGVDADVDAMITAAGEERGRVVSEKAAAPKRAAPGDMGWVVMVKPLASRTCEVSTTISAMVKRSFVAILMAREKEESVRSRSYDTSC